MLSDRTVVSRIVDASEEMKKMKLSQAMGGDNAVLYTYTTSISATVQSGDAGRYLEGYRLVGFTSDIPFCLASATLTVTAGGSTITSWTLDSHYQVRRYSSSGVGVTLQSDSALGYEELSSVPTTETSGQFKAYWGIMIEGSQNNTYHPLTLATGTTVTATLTLKVNQEGKIE